MRLGLLLILILSAPAFAGGRPRVLVRATGPAATRSAFAASLGELLERLGVELVLQGEVPLGGPFLAVAGVEFGDGEGCGVAVDDAEGRLGLKRRLSGAGAVVAETAAHVVQSAIEELVLPSPKRTVEAPRPSSAPLVEVPAAEVVAPRPLAPLSPPVSVLDVGVHAGARGVGGAPLLVVAAGVSVTGWGEVFGRRAGGAFALAYLPELEAVSAEVGVRVQALAPRGLAVMQVAGSGAWALDLMVGGGADVFLARTVSSLVPQNRVRPPRLDATPVLTAALDLRWRLSAGATVVLTAGGDLDLSPITYVARLGPTTETLFAPWTVRPTLTLGFVFSALGRAGGVP